MLPKEQACSLKDFDSLGYSSDTIIAFFSKKILLSERLEHSRSHIQKAVKLTVMAQGYYLGYFGKKLFDDNIYAYKYGPVVKIQDNISLQGISPNQEIVFNTHQELSILEKIWEVYGDYSGIHISALMSSPTHFWHRQWEEAKIKAATMRNISKKDLKRITIIPCSYIENFYRHLIS